MFDNLGTAIILLDGNGNIVYKQHYAPFGQKDKSHSSKKPDSCNNGEENDPFPYGFTGHFGDDESGLIYMGARYYNPTIAQFLTPDAVLPSPTDSLSYNRYSYTRNNPINLVDPSGNFFWAPIIGAIIGGLMAAVSGQNILMGMWIGAASGAFFGAAGGSFWGSVAAGFASGAMNSALYGGNILRGAIVGAISAGIGYGIGSLGRNLFPSLKGYGMGVVSAISGGVVGGLSSVMMGGSFSEGFKMGFISAGLSYAAAEVAAAIKTSGVEGGKEEAKFNKLDPINDIPDAETLSEEQRRAIILQGGEMNYNNDILAGTEEVRNELLAKHYKVDVIPLKTEKEAMHYLNEKDFSGITVIVRVHHYLVNGSSEGKFSWSGGGRWAVTADKQMVTLLAKSRTVVFLSCNTSYAAELYFTTYHKPAWGLSGFMTTTYTSDPFWGYRASFWSEGIGKWYH